MSAEESLARAEELLARLEKTRAELEQLSQGVRGRARVEPATLYDSASVG